MVVTISIPQARNLNLERREHMHNPGMQQKGISARFALTAIWSLMLFGVVSRSEAQEILPPPMNPLQAATLHWYAANQTTQSTLGGRPGGADVDRVWVGGHNIVKLRASDGTNLGSFDIGNTDQNPSQGMAFDGVNIWAANSGTNGATATAVSKVGGSDGAILGVVTVGSAPEA